MAIFKASSGLDQLDLNLKIVLLVRYRWKRLGGGLEFDAGLCVRDGAFVNCGDQTLVFDGQLINRCVTVEIGVSIENARIRPCA